jgi:ABC-type transport system involved in multi-copper enzyme maturation permease subunit
MQLWAILVDTWRLLCARRLFWITLVLTALIGVMYASVGFHENGFSVLFRISFNNVGLRRGTPEAEAFYLRMFYMIVYWWTTFFGVILALVSGASIFPEFMASGSIDSVLSKPISRAGLFFSKYLSGLIFAGAQVALLAVIVYAAIKWRLGFWHHAVFWSVPFGLLLYSYLYAVNVLIGVWTRSALASLLLVLLFWTGVAFLQMTEKVFAELSRTSTAEVLRRTSDRSANRAPTANVWEKFHRTSQVLMAVLPKTSETTDLIRRSVMREPDQAVNREQEIEKAVEGQLQLESLLGQGRPASNYGTVRSKAEQAFDAMQALEKSGVYIIGTSLLFEAAVLALACWIFARRDY